MPFSEKSLDDYVDVAQRIADFRERYPAGSLQPLDPARPWEQATVTGYRKDGTETTQTFIVYCAAAFRAPDDERPGIGVAWEVWPGRTPYTLGSELMNAETSAWGRAIVAVLASDSKQGVASRQEVKARRAERDDGLPVNADGSLSRSRTTDEEKAAAGVMTGGQQRAHSALGREVQGKGPQGTQRQDSTPGDDPWYDQPGPLASAENPETRPGSISRQQQAAMHAKFAALGITDRHARLNWTRIAVSRQVGSSNDLSYVEAGQLLEALDEESRERSKSGAAAG